jgi:hypothetical protein
MEQITLPLLMEWATYFQIEPDAETRADARHGIQAYLIARTMGGVKNAKPSDYIPTWEPPKPQTVQEAVAVAMKMTAMMKGTFH